MFKGIHRREIYGKSQNKAFRDSLLKPYGINPATLDSKTKDMMVEKYTFEYPLFFDKINSAKTIDDALILLSDHPHLLHGAKGYDIFELIIKKFGSEIRQSDHFKTAILKHAANSQYVKSLKFIVESLYRAKLLSLDAVQAVLTTTRVWANAESLKFILNMPSIDIKFLKLERNQLEFYFHSVLDSDNTESLTMLLDTFKDKLKTENIDSLLCDSVRRNKWNFIPILIRFLPKLPDYNKKYLENSHFQQRLLDAAIASGSKKMLSHVTTLLQLDPQQDFSIEKLTRNSYVGNTEFLEEELQRRNNFTDKEADGLMSYVTLTSKDRSETLKLIFKKLPSELLNLIINQPINPPLFNNKKGTLYLYSALMHNQSLIFSEMFEFFSTLMSPAEMMHLLEAIPQEHKMHSRISNISLHFYTQKIFLEKTIELINKVYEGNPNYKPNDDLFNFLNDSANNINDTRSLNQLNLLRNKNFGQRAT